MKEPRPDDERLSALLDGRLSGKQREDVLAHLVAADEDYDVFTDAAAILREAEEGTRLPPPPSLRRGRIWRTPTPRSIAVLVIVGLVAFGVWTRRGPAPAAGPLAVASALSDSRQPLPADWMGRRDWLLYRGDGTGAEAAARSARAGVLLADLVIAVRSGDSAAVHTLATQLDSRFDARVRGPLDEIAARAGEDAASLEPLVRDAAARLEDRMERGPLRLGAWTETASIAAGRRDAAFFRADASRGMLDAAEGLTEGNATARDALARVRAALPEGGAPDWTELDAGLEALLRSIAS